MALHERYGEKKVIESQSTIPRYDPSRTPFYYDYQEHKWVYRDEKVRRANTYKGDSRIKEDINEIIEEKLIKGVDGYFEDTYWGEDYELTDIEDEE